MKVPKISIIIPTFNRPQLLKRCLQSIIAQTYTELEIIVINDGNIPIEESINPFFNQIHIIVINNPSHKGRSASRNSGLCAATGEYICYCDDDDIFYPNHCETLITALMNSPKSIAYSDAVNALHVVKPDGTTSISKQVVYAQEYNQDHLLVDNQFPILSIMHKKSCLDQSGVFDESLDSHEDWDLWIRMSRVYEFLHVSQSTAEYTTYVNAPCEHNKIIAFLTTRKLIYTRYNHLTANKPHLRELQKKALHVQHMQIELQHHVYQFIESITNLVENKHVSEAFTLYQNQRKQFNSFPGLETLDAIMNALKHKYNFHD